MKKRLAMLLAIVTVLALHAPALAAGDAREVYTIAVNGQAIDLVGLPVAPYQEGDTVMVPLRRIGEALGYQVDWNAQTNAITMDDEYIQKATLFAGTATVTFEGRLKVIDMSREMENAAPTVVYEGCTYVPLEFFQEFFNDTEIDGTNLSIAPSKAYTMDRN